MTPTHQHDYIQSYEAGIAALKTRPSDRDLQHQVVLSLARAGALDFAIAEYARFGLAEINDHEDIMALNGRLSKDLYLRSSGSIAAKHAKEAAEKYEAAFQKSLGYYSGINSATMALMADLPEDRVMARIEAIEALLPASRELTPTDHYFVEATRAECFLLKGEQDRAADALHAAIDFDPLNYAAHASTLKQFMMIATKQGVSPDWLRAFRPPRPLHYAGHIRLPKTIYDPEAIRISISDALQQEDVGFGYGALAAGGDILFAESLLEQGAELHVILPTDKVRFKRESVLPFGQEWEARFEACLAQASSFRCVSKDGPWPDQSLNRISGISAMGQTILKGQSLSVAPIQMLIINASEKPSYTATHAQDWARHSSSQFRITNESYRPLTLTSFVPDTALPCGLKISGENSVKRFENLNDALASALAVRKTNETAQIALHLVIEGEDLEGILSKILEGGAPQSLLASEAFSTALATFEGERFKITYAGQVGVETDDPTRCYTIQPAEI